jgi:hypothetical protein
MGQNRDAREEKGREEETRSTLPCLTQGGSFQLSSFPQARSPKRAFFSHSLRREWTARLSAATKAGFSVSSVPLRLYTEHTEDISELCVEPLVTLEGTGPLVA